MAERKPRFAFTLQKEIFLLKTLLQVNPWDFGENCWDDAVKNFCTTRGWVVTERTGTEEEKTERASVLEEIEKIAESAEIQKIVVVHREVDDNEFEEVCSETATDSSGNNDLSKNHETATITPVVNTKKQVVTEKMDAVSSREKYLKFLVQENTPPGPITFRRKRARVTEEEFMEKSQEHDMYIDTKRVELEECKEKRLREEGERRDDIAKLQLQIQKEHLNSRRFLWGSCQHLLTYSVE
ncbi:unnamed protein product [Allacma fusca]|uniref:Uncharacterized protein n=1 Tax=Allacma fusca TaxID=39272 RepID=A0A8J2JFB4_9HEXA|nr:unnamed protein product [Allacma fusca]